MSARILLGIGVVLALAACGAKSSSGSGGPGLYGTVRVDPATPVCGIGISCAKPAAGFRLVFVQGRRRSVTVTTDRHGRYRVHLAHGRYLVRPGARESAPRGLRPATVIVPRGHLARRDFTYDAGIR